MDFTLSEEQLALKQVIKEFADNEIAPNAAKWDQECIFPIDAFQKSAEIGIGGLYTSSSFGGSELSRLESCIVFEELATACVSTAAYISIHNMVCWLIDTYASENLKQKYLPDLCRFEKLSSYCLTEPGSGSDAANMKSLAIKKDGYYVLNGSKAFISGGSVSNIYVCMVRTKNENDETGISCLLIDKDTKGLGFGEKEKKLGWNCQPTTTVYFDNCEIPFTNLIGTENEGFKIALEALNGGRVNIAACSVGGAKSCLERSRLYCAERQQFNTKLENLQAIQFKLADIATNLHAARLTTYYAASALDNKQNAESNNYIMYCAMAKQLATDIAFTISDTAMQIHGGYGYLNEYQIERYFRDLRVHKILEGTNEIMRLVIAKHLISGANIEVQ